MKNVFYLFVTAGTCWLENFGDHQTSSLCTFSIRLFQLPDDSGNLFKLMPFLLQLLHPPLANRTSFQMQFDKGLLDQGKIFIQQLFQFNVRHMFHISIPIYLNPPDKNNIHVISLILIKIHFHKYL